MKLLLALTFSLLFAGDLLACKVPVFRYALERWPADNFRLLVTAEGPLPAPLQDSLAQVAKSLDAKPRPVNLELEILDLATLSEAQRLSTPGLEQADADPRMILLPPESWRSNDPVWSGPATVENLTALLDSPLRQRCAEHLLKGETTVWILVLSGDDAQDAAAKSLLDEGLQMASSLLEIPEGVIRREDLNKGLENIDLDDVLRSDLPLKISFVTETLSRTDPAEALFLTTLLGPAPPRANAPLLVPIFGRGRTAGPVSAAAVTPDRILAACQYLCASCSCQVKEGNPGYDLLFKTNWDELLQNSLLALDSELVTNALDIITIEGDSDSDPAPPRGWLGPIPPVLIVGLALLSAVLFLLYRKSSL